MPSNSTTTSFPVPPGCLERLTSLLGKKELLILGVTGGIASGKTAVAHMLEELGAVTIDLDIVARQVVEPGKPAWKEIVGYFGPEVVLADDHLDRKRLSGMIFRDKNKRKKLESFTHPRIFEGLVSRIDEIAEKNPRALIQVIVPLLYEFNLQDLFHRVLVVYIPFEKQVERLKKRDGIGRKEASRMLGAQLPIDRKVALADFVINNENSLEETGKQVQDLWQRLVEIQKRPF